MSPRKTAFHLNASAEQDLADSSNMCKNLLYTRKLPYAVLCSVDIGNLVEKMLVSIRPSTYKEKKMNDNNSLYICAQAPTTRPILETLHIYVMFKMMSPLSCKM